MQEVDKGKISSGPMLSQVHFANNQLRAVANVKPFIFWCHFYEILLFPDEVAIGRVLLGLSELDVSNSLSHKYHCAHCLDGRESEDRLLLTREIKLSVLIPLLHHL